MSMTRKKTIALLLSVVVLAAAGAAGYWAYDRFATPTSSLGGPCRDKDDCSAEAEVCLKPRWRNMGVCTRRCKSSAGCPPGLVCRPIAEVERGDRQEARTGGESRYCFKERRGPKQGTDR
jgi:hypothetical protein